MLARTQDTTHRHYTPTTPPLSSVTRGWSVDSFFEVELPASLVSSAVLLSCCRLSYVVFSCTFARKSRRPQTIIGKTLFQVEREKEERRTDQQEQEGKGWGLQERFHVTPFGLDMQLINGIPYLYRVVGFARTHVIIDP